MHRQINNQDLHKGSKNYLFPTIAFSLIFIAILIWLVLSMMVSRKFEITQTQLTLRDQACALMSHESIPTNSLSSHENFCLVTVPFRANKFSNGGMIYINDREILISDHQVISTEMIDPQSVTHEQIKSLLLSIVSLVFIAAFAAVIFFELKKRS